MVMASGQEDRPDDDDDDDEKMKTHLPKTLATSNSSLPSAMEKGGKGKADGEDDDDEVAEEEEGGGGLLHGVNIRRYQKRASFREERQFPPPIPLVSLGNLPGHMPWVLRRSYEDDGGCWRLVMREVKVKHHEYLRPLRSNGRLILQRMHSHIEESPRRQDPSSSDQEQENDAQNPNNMNAGPDSIPPSPSTPPSSPPPSMVCDPNADEMSNQTNAEMDSPGPVATDGEEEANSENKGEVDPCSPAENPNMNGSAAVGMAGGCLVASMFQIPIPTIRPVHS